MNHITGTNANTQNMGRPRSGRNPPTPWGRGAPVRAPLGVLRPRGGRANAQNGLEILPGETARGGGVAYG